MRILPTLAAIGAAMALTACTYVERQPPAQTVVQPPPTVVQPAPATPPSVTVSPRY